ncbi:hypothetical protein KIW84_041617 [Lathyrus oleraceus]|uniref:Reverse transcriptase zinc-binding domain-containing protein n=1 Tax=Pisum sativum TaxID=3888 RepID=A0A9D4X8Q4_PEA|nr:hypothetical protein KIW84_041617 [Pisum sativum]
MWSIGNGKNVDAWGEIWIAPNLQSVDLHIEIPMHMQNIKFVDIRNDETGWNWEALEHWLPQEMIQRMATIMPPSTNAGPYIRVGIGQDGKSFSVGTMYGLLDDYGEGTSSETWRNIWKIQAIERVRHFLLIVQHDRLLTNSRRHRMCLGSAMCPFCNNVEEDALHVLRDSSHVAAIWMATVHTNNRLSFFSRCGTTKRRMMEVSIDRHGSSNKFHVYAIRACSDHTKELCLTFLHLQGIIAKNNFVTVFIVVVITATIYDHRWFLSYTVSTATAVSTADARLRLGLFVGSGVGL